MSHNSALRKAKRLIWPSMSHGIEGLGEVSTIAFSPESNIFIPNIVL